MRRVTKREREKLNVYYMELIELYNKTINSVYAEVEINERIFDIEKDIGENFFLIRKMKSLRVMSYKQGNKLFISELDLAIQKQKIIFILEN